MPVPRTPTPRISPHKIVDNGQVASSGLANIVSEKLNTAAKWVRKEVFRKTGTIPTSQSGTRRRWNFAFHTGMLAKRIVIRPVLALHKGASGGDNPYITFVLNGPPGIGTITATHYFGGGVPVVDPTDSPEEFSYPRLFLDVSPNTDYTATFNDVDGGRLVSASVHEESLPVAEGVGFIDGRTDMGGPIYSATREKTLPMMDEMWRYGGAHCFNWAANTDADYRFSATPNVYTNIIDNSSTTVSAATPGYVLDLRYKNRRSQSTVPCVLRVLGETGSSTGTGEVRLKDSAGSTIATVTLYSSVYLNDGVTASGFWWSTAVDMPATRAKYDIHYGHPTGGAEIYAVSMYEFDGDLPTQPALSDSAAAASRFWTTKIPRQIRRRGGNRR